MDGECKTDASSQNCCFYGHDFYLRIGSHPTKIDEEYNTVNTSMPGLLLFHMFMILGWINSIIWEL